MSRATPSKPPALYDPAEVQKSLTLLLPAAQVTELRALEAVLDGDRRAVTATGYFDDPQKLIESLRQIRAAKGIYVVLNPVEPALLARAANRIRPVGKGDSTADTNILRRHWLLIDCDPRRPSGISSTDAEHEAAIERARQVYAYLRECGWPEPIAADSGNGGHLPYHIDLPVDDGGIVQRCLTALAKRFDDEAVSIDQTVFNPARIWKLYGTLACKGDHTAERPHRMSRILSAPSELAIVPIDKLEALAAQTPGAAPADSNGHAAARGGAAAFDVAAFVTRNRLDVEGPHDWNGQQGRGQRWTFRISPMCEHHDGSAFILQHASGAISAKCQHNSCGWSWTDLRARFEPGGKVRNCGAASANGKPNRAHPTLWLPKIVRASDIQSREREWLWPHRIVVGGVNMLVGRPDNGKSLIAIDISARVTVGSPWPDCDASAPLGGVVLLSAEDDPETTIRPRLDAAGADCNRIALLQGAKLDEADDPQERLLRLDTDVDLLASAVQQVEDCRLVVIDPISAYMGGADDHKNADVRGVLAKLSDLAAHLRVAVLLVSHLRKGGDAHAVNQVMGSLGYVAQARMVWTAGWHTTKDADGKPRRRRVIALVKGNLTRQRTGLEYVVTARHSDSDEPHIEWRSEPVDLSADELLAPPKSDKRGPDAAQRDAAESFLLRVLADGPRLATEVTAEAKNEEISERTLKRARKELGIVAYRDHVPGPWMLRLPGCNESPPPDTEASGPLGTLAANPSDFDTSNDCDAQGCQDSQCGTLAADTNGTLDETTRSELDDEWGDV